MRKWSAIRFSRFPNVLACCFSQRPAAGMWSVQKWDATRPFISAVSAVSGLYVLVSRITVRLQERTQLGEGFAAMAHGRLRIAGFRERLAVGRVEENRVVTEAALPSR